MLAVALDRVGLSVEHRRLGLRIAALAALYLLFDALEWTWLHRNLRAVVAIGLEYLNHGVAFGASEPRSSYLSVDGTLFRITRGCTYVNLALTMVPFLWRFDRTPVNRTLVNRTLGRNLFRVLVWFALVYIVNVVRLVFAAHFTAADWTWAAAHDWPNRLIRGFIVVPAVLLALRADRDPMPPARIV